MCQAPSLYTPWAVAAATTRPIDLHHRQQELEREKEKIKQQLRHTKTKQRAAGYELKVTERRLRTTRNQLAQTDAQLYSTRSELDGTNRRLQAALTRLDGHREAMSSRLVAIYEHGGIEYLDVLAGSASFADFANRLYLVQLMVDQDFGLMKAMQEERERIERYRRKVETQEHKLVQLEARVERKHEQVASQRKDKARLVGKLRQQRIYWERALAEMEQESRAIGAQIRRYQRSTGRARYATPWTGSFIKPVNSGITSGFGYRIHPILGVRKMHTGIDISAATGTPIRAADAGAVISSGRRGGYGLCVVIDHGGGMSTVYGHCSRLAVTAGREVRQGQVIGYVGSTGLSTGPHLHFEVRRDGTPVNPQSY